MWHILLTSFSLLSLSFGSIFIQMNHPTWIEPHQNKPSIAAFYEYQYEKVLNSGPVGAKESSTHV